MESDWTSRQKWAAGLFGGGAIAFVTLSIYQAVSSLPPALKFGITVVGGLLVLAGATAAATSREVLFDYWDLPLFGLWIGTLILQETVPLASWTEAVVGTVTGLAILAIGIRGFFKLRSSDD